MNINTFSIVAYDPAAEAFGIGVASKFLAVGAAVTWAEAKVGAVATQALAKIGFGPDGLALMEQGYSAPDTLTLLLQDDILREQRQVALVDANGVAAAHTGSDCYAYAGHRVGEGYSVQGNILAGADVLEAMEAAYLQTSGVLELRLLAALQAADAAGGDKRGKQSAALLVVKPGGGYGGDTDRYLDLRVDDDPAPLVKMASLVEMHGLFFGKPDPADDLLITEDIARELQTMMVGQGYYNGEVNGHWDDSTIWAFWAMVGNENLEERWNPTGSPNTLDRIALEYLRSRFSSK
jgi:uncharacterized Ntn-hydrolase superfamily protein